MERVLYNLGRGFSNNGVEHMSLNTFFNEWYDDPKIYTVLATALTATMMVALLGLYVNLNAPLDKYSMVYLSMLVIGVIVGGIDFIIEKNPLFAFLYAGKSYTAAGFALLIGIIAGLFAIGTSKAVFFPSFATTSSSSEPLFFGISAGFFFVVLIAPYAEEKFFRMVTMPTFNVWFRNLRFKILSNTFVCGALAAVLTSLAFGLYHWSAYGGSIAYIQSAFIFSIIAIIGNYALKSVFFGVGLHFTNNFISYGGLH